MILNNNRMLIPVEKLSIDEILKIFFIKENYPLHVYIDGKRLKTNFEHICNAFLYSPYLTLWAYGDNFFDFLPVKEKKKADFSLDVETFTRCIYNSYDVSRIPPNTSLVILDEINIYSSEGTFWYPTLLLINGDNRVEFKKVREVGMKWTTLFKFFKTFFPTREDFSIYKNSPNPYFNFYLYLRSLYAEYNKISSLDLEKALLNPQIKKEDKARILDELMRRKVLSTRL